MKTTVYLEEQKEFLVTVTDNSFVSAVKFLWPTREAAVLIAADTTATFQLDDFPP